MTNLTGVATVDVRTLVLGAICEFVVEIDEAAQRPMQRGGVMSITQLAAAIGDAIGPGVEYIGDPGIVLKVPLAVAIPTAAAAVAVVAMLYCCHLRSRHQWRRVPIFLSYRVAADQAFVERLYHVLLKRGLSVFWDRECLKNGQDWEQGFVAGLFSAKVFVPVLSKQALLPYTELREDSRADNLLLEQLLALEQSARGAMPAILPLFIGERSPCGAFRKFAFADLPAADASCARSVASVDEKARAHLLSACAAAADGSQPVLRVSDRRPSAILNALCRFQGVFVEGEADAALEYVAQLVYETVADVVAGQVVAEAKELKRGMAPPRELQPRGRRRRDSWLGAKGGAEDGVELLDCNARALPSTSGPACDKPPHSIRSQSSYSSSSARSLPRLPVAGSQSRLVAVTPIIKGVPCAPSADAVYPPAGASSQLLDQFRNPELKEDTAGLNTNPVLAHAARVDAASRGGSRGSLAKGKGALARLEDIGLAKTISEEERNQRDVEAMLRRESVGPSAVKVNVGKVRVQLQSAQGQFATTNAYTDTVSAQQRTLVRDARSRRSMGEIGGK